MLFTKEKIREFEFIDFSEIDNERIIYAYDGYHIEVEFRAWSRYDYPETDRDGTGYQGGYYIEDIEVTDVTITNEDEVKLAGIESVDRKQLEMVIACDLDHRDYAELFY